MNVVTHIKLSLFMIPFFSNSFGAYTNAGVKKQGKTTGGSMEISSPAFKNGQPISRKYTCDGDNVSPELTWRGVSAGAKSLALICDDPDAPTEKPWVHWVVYNLSPELRALSEGAAIDSLGKQGPTDFVAQKGYGGPCPPKGHGVHRYYFKLYALDIDNLPDGLTKEKLLEAMKGHILDKAQLMGTYARL